MPVDGAVYAQPLYVAALNLPGAGTHNVVFVVTMHNSVYAFDADAAGASLWQVNLGPSVPGNAYSDPANNYVYTDIQPEIGILSTPVIDPAAGTMYVVASTLSNGVYAFYLHALDITTGNEKPGSPVTLNAAIAGQSPDSVDGVLTFDASLHLQRPGLLLLGGRVYIGFGSHGDEGNYHGWILAYDATTLKQAWAMSATPNGLGGALWQSGRGLASDGISLYVVTGNGANDGVANWGESALRLDANTGAVLDWFTPSDWFNLNEKDLDFGSAGLILTPGSPYVIAGGKEGNIYVMDETQFGHAEGLDAQLIHKFAVVHRGADAVATSNRVKNHVEGGPAVGFGLFNYAFWPSSAGSYLFTRTSYDVLRAFLMNPDGTFQIDPTSVSINSHAKSFDGFTVSSNGADVTTGIIWQATTDFGTQPAPGVLHALSAGDLALELWSSAAIPLRDGYGTFTKFCNPTVANGKVYVATNSSQVAIYGLLPSAEPANITSVVNGASGLSGPIAPGEIVHIFGNAIGPPSLIQASADPDGTIGNELSGYSVLFNGQTAPLLSAGPNEIVAVVPYAVNGSPTASIQIAVGESETAVFVIPVASSAPGLFTLDGSGFGQCSCLNEDDSINGPANPASPGDIVSIYATGQGMPEIAQKDGLLALAPPYPAPKLPVTVSIGGKQAEVVFAGTAPTMVGVIQVNAVVPDDVTPSLTEPVVLTIGKSSSPSQATISVQ